MDPSDADRVSMGGSGGTARGMTGSGGAAAGVIGSVAWGTAMAWGSWAQEGAGKAGAVRSAAGGGGWERRDGGGGGWERRDGGGGGCERCDGGGGGWERRDGGGGGAERPDEGTEAGASPRELGPCPGAELSESSEGRREGSGLVSSLESIVPSIIVSSGTALGTSSQPRSTKEVRTGAGGRPF
jgi:translation initiation factor 3 subunit A